MKQQPVPDKPTMKQLVEHTFGKQAAEDKDIVSLYEDVLKATIDEYNVSDAVEFATWTRLSGWDILIDEKNSNWLHFEEQQIVTGEELYQIFKKQ